MTRLRLLLSIIFFFSSLSTPVAQSDNLGPCRIKASEVRQKLSLGFPVGPERLAKLSAPKILVVPFQLEDTPNYSFSAELKQRYERATDYINEFSNGKSKPQFVFSPVIKTEITENDIRNLRDNQNIGNQTRNESISTWGFIRSFVSKYDSNLDFTEIDGVILQGSASSRGGIAEAMTYLRNYDTYWRPLKTNEGEVLNAVLMDSAQDSATIAHEVMHLYGLTDLYGTNTGPGPLSLMSSNALNLLSYEKWILGWLPDSDVTCLANVAESTITKFSFDYTKINQIAIIRAGSNETFIAETTKVRDTRFLTFYSIDNEARPPITVFQDGSKPQFGGEVIGDYNAIGIQFEAPNFTLLVSDLNSTSISLNLVPKSLSASAEFKSLIDSSNAAKNASELKAKQEAEAKAAAELKAKQDADAKAAEELKSKQDAEAKAAAELKAKQEAAAKAAAKKKVTITCVKGKLSKKVTAVKPKCPSGYKLKK